MNWCNCYEACVQFLCDSWMLSKLAFVNKNCSSVGAHAAPPSNEHSTSWFLFLRILSNGFLVAHYWIARRALGAFFALVTLLAVMSFGACGTISTLNKTKPARVPTGRQIKFAISFTIFASMTLSIPLSNRVTKISFLNIEQAINLVLNHQQDMEKILHKGIATLSRTIVVFASFGVVKKS